MKPDKKRLNAASRLWISESLPWAAWLVAEQLLLRARDIFFRWLFKAPGLHLGWGCILRGTKFIHFGRNVYAHGHLWLEAIVAHREQRFTPCVEIGDGVSFSEGVHISCVEKIVIGKNALLGSGVYISDHNHGLYNGPTQSHPEEAPVDRQLGGGGPVSIGDNVWIGDNVVIVGPISIGRGAILGANSFVREDVPNRTTVAGSPAKPVKRFDASTGQWERC